MGQQPVPGTGLLRALQLQSVKRPETQSQVSWVLTLALPGAWLPYLKHVFTLGLTFLICKMRGSDEMTSKFPLTLNSAEAARRQGEVRS